VTPENIDGLTLTNAEAYETGNLRQYDKNAWHDIAGELVTNKLTANYINALDITAKKITVLQNSTSAILFEADGLSTTPSVQIAGFEVDSNSISKNGLGEKGSVIMCTGTDGKANIGGSDLKDGWVFAAGNNFGVRLQGYDSNNNPISVNSASVSATKSELYVDNGKIGGFVIGNDSIHSLSYTAPGSSDVGVMISNGANSTTSIGGSSGENV